MRFFRSAHRVMPALPEEGPALADLYRRAWAECDGLFDPRLIADQVPSTDEVRSWFSGGFEICRTLHEERPAGVVRLSFPSGTCHLDRLAVDPDLRRLCHGRSLVEHGVARARRAGATRVWTQVSPKVSDAFQFFRDAGFRETARHLAPYWGETILLLELPLI
jgi:ribosomal protein S18 acetylase RimI-like enzyme